MRRPRIERPSDTRNYVIALGIVVVATIAMLVIRDSLGVLNVTLIYLLIVLELALTMGSGPSTAMAVVSFVLFDFLFIPPFHTLTIADTDHVLTVFVYLGVAIVTSQLVARVRSRTEVAIREQRRTAMLYELNAGLIGDAKVPDMLTTIVEQVVRVYGASASRILLPGPPDQRLTPQAQYPPDAKLPLDRQMTSVAEWALDHRTPAGLGAKGRKVRVPHGISTDSLHNANRPEQLLYVPIATATRNVGVLEVHGKGTVPDSEAETILTSFANQAALAIERGRLSEEEARAEALAESDELKSALLAAVSHDLRTPLAVIKTATSSLLDTSIDWPESERAEFLEAIDAETDRLTSMVSNLLDLSRIEGGVLRPDREWYDVPELIADVTDRLETRASARGHEIRVELAEALPIAFLDYVEIAQVLMNLGENAIKYGTTGEPVTFSVTTEPAGLRFCVHNGGPAIPLSDQTHLFDTFYRSPGNRSSPGSGIGLAIAKGIVEAHGGRIWVESAAAKGTTFCFTIPAESGASVMA